MNLLTQDEQSKIHDVDSRSTTGAGLSHKKSGLSGRICKKGRRRKINKQKSDKQLLDPIEEKKDEPNGS